MVTETSSKPPEHEGDVQRNDKASERETERAQEEAAEERKDERGYQ
jgi:hypothetical protein